METIPCLHCGRSHKKGARFCPSTGKSIPAPPLEKLCPLCGQTVVLRRPDSKFCTKCGGDINADAACPYPDCRKALCKPFIFCPSCRRKIGVCGKCGSPAVLKAPRCPKCAGPLAPVTGAWRSFKGTPDRCSFTEESLVFPLRRAWTFADAGAPAAISPVVYGGIVFIATTGGGLYALNQYNGSLVWSKPLESPLISSPVVDADVIYQATSSGKVYCLDREKGRLNWVFPATKRGIGSVHASLLLADDSLIAVTMKGKIFCLDRKTGKSRWLTPVRAGESLGEVTAGPAASEARLVVAARDGYVLCCSLDDGRVLWRFPEEPLATKILSTPAICHGMVYFAERGGKCYALDLATGGDRWDLATQLAGIVEGSPAVAGERVFIGTWDSLFCLDRFAGGILWKARNENLPSLDSINTTPVVTASGQVLYGGDSGYFYARTSSGEEIWKYRFDEPFVGNPVVSDGFLYTITRSGVLTALRSAT